MSGTVRMSGIAHGVSIDPVVYDKDGIVRVNEHNAVSPDTITDTTESTIIKMGEKPVQYAPAYSSQYYSDSSATPQVTNAKTVSTETAAEARVAAKARKAKAK
jgi:hypothetical protein